MMSVQHFSRPLYQDLREQYPEVPEEVLAKLITQNKNDPDRCKEAVQKESKNYQDTLYGEFVAATGESDLPPPGIVAQQMDKLLITTSNVYDPSGGACKTVIRMEDNRARSDSSSSRTSNSSSGNNNNANCAKTPTNGPSISHSQSAQQFRSTHQHTIGSRSQSVPGVINHLEQFVGPGQEGVLNKLGIPCSVYSPNPHGNTTISTVHNAGSTSPQSSHYAYSEVRTTVGTQSRSADGIVTKPFTLNVHGGQPVQGMPAQQQWTPNAYSPHDVSGGVYPSQQPPPYMRQYGVNAPISSSPGSTRVGSPMLGPAAVGTWMTQEAGAQGMPQNPASSSPVNQYQNTTFVTHTTIQMGTRQTPPSVAPGVAHLPPRYPNPNYQARTPSPNPQGSVASTKIAHVMPTPQGMFSGGNHTQVPTRPPPLPPKPSAKPQVPKAPQTPPPKMTGVVQEETRPERSLSESSEDMAYTQALLLHQRARMAKLIQDITDSHISLDRLKQEVAQLELENSQQQRARSNSFPTLDDIQSVRAENRRLQVDVQLLTREVDMYNGQEPLGVYDGRGQQEFYSNIDRGQDWPLNNQHADPSNPPPSVNPAIRTVPDPRRRPPRPPPPSTHPPAPPRNPPSHIPLNPQPPHHQPAPPPQDPDEGENWNCSACTFLNHPALDKCECCEMPKITLSGYR